MFERLWHQKLRRPYRLYCSHLGDHSKPTLVLLHGIAASSEDWRHILPYLEPHFHCITIDLLGFGKSPKPQWAAYTMDDHMRSIYHTLNRLHLGKDFILAGHSLGSLLAARYASQHERNLSHLLLLSPPVYPPLDSIKGRFSRRLTGLLLSIYRILRDETRITPATFKKLTYVAPLPKTIITHPQTWVPFMRTLKECIEQQTILEDVDGLHLPVEVFYGTLDQVLVSKNVELLGERENVRLHTFLGTHDLTKRYGQKIADILIKL